MFLHLFLIIASQYSSENSKILLIIPVLGDASAFFFSKFFDILINREFFTSRNFEYYFLFEMALSCIHPKGTIVSNLSNWLYLLKEYSIEYSSLFLSSFNLKWNFSYSISVFLYYFSVFFLNSRTNHCTESQIKRGIDLITCNVLELIFDRNLSII